jgi:hypothetical protein
MEDFNCSINQLYLCTKKRPAKYYADDAFRGGELHEIQCVAKYILPLVLLLNWHYRRKQYSDNDIFETGYLAPRSNLSRGISKKFFDRNAHREKGFCQPEPQPENKRG